jgi:hypothetical protein
MTRSALALLLALIAPACRMESQEVPRDPGSATEQVTIGDVTWYVDYAAALQVGRDQDKPLWVHFGENPG